MTNSSFRHILYTFILGLCCGIMAITLYLAISGNIPFLKAAGLNTGAADVNARYLDGYGTATATSSSKVYISDGSGYLPDGSVDTGAIVDGTIANADISGSAAIDVSKLTGVRPTTSATTSISLTTSCDGNKCNFRNSDLYDFATCNRVCIQNGYTTCYGFTGAACTSSATAKYWNFGGTWTSVTVTYTADCDGEAPGQQPCCSAGNGYLTTAYCAR